MSLPLNVALVDDEKDFHVLFKMTFKKLIRENKIKLFNFLDGTEFVEFLDKHQEEINILILISDINMPQMDGITLVKHVNEKYPEIKTYVASAYGSKDHMERAKEVGAIDFFTKPIDFTIVEKIFLEYIEKAG